MVCEEWTWSPTVVGAIATTVGTLVALMAATIPALWRRHKTTKLARTLFAYDVTSLMLESGSLSGPYALAKLREGLWPTALQIRAVEIPHIKEYIDKLGPSSNLQVDLAQLLNQCDVLRWRISNLSDPDIDYDHGKSENSDINRERNRTAVFVMAANVHETAQRLHLKLCRPARWKTWCK